MTISVIIPVFNCEKYIEKCLESVLSQKGADLDVIVINDGSFDKTDEILTKYEKEVRIKKTPNRGISAARNEGIRMIRGEYTMFLDSDDYLKAGTIETLSSVIEETDADIVKFRYKLVYPNGKEKLPGNQFDKYDLIEKKDFKEKVYPYFINGIRLNSMCVGIYRSDLIKGREFREDMPVAEDAVFSIGTYTLAGRLAVIPDILYYYYQTGKGLTGSGTNIKQKYRCNFIFAKETSRLLKEWDMNTLFMKIRVWLRPLLLTFDKIMRVLQSKKTGSGD